MFRVTVIKNGDTFVYEVDLKQMSKEVRAWSTDEGGTAIIIHKIQGEKE